MTLTIAIILLEAVYSKGGILKTVGGLLIAVVGS